MPADMLATLPGYDPDVAKNRAQAQQIMQGLGYGPDKRLAVTVTTRNVAAYRDPAVILIDQLKDIYIDGTLNPIDTTQWYPTVMRKDYTLGFTVSETGLDDPDQMFYENYLCGSERNYTGYCNAEVDKLIDQQSVETDTEKRRQLVWRIEKYLAEDGGRPINLSPALGDLLLPAGQGHHRRGEQPVQFMAHGGRLARPPMTSRQPAGRQALRLRADDRGAMPRAAPVSAS